MAGTQWYTRKQHLYNKRSQGCLPMLESNILENIHVSLIPLFILCCFVEHQDFHHISCSDSCTCSGSEGTHMPLEVSPNSSPSRLLKKFLISFLTSGEVGKSRVFLQVCWQDHWMTDDSCQQSMWYFWWSSDITRKCRKSMEIPTCHGWKIPESSVFTFLAGHLLLKLQLWESINPSIHLSSLGKWLEWLFQIKQYQHKTDKIPTPNHSLILLMLFSPPFHLLVPPPPKKKQKTYNNPAPNDDGTCRAAGGGGAAVGGMYFSAEVSSPASARRLRSRRSSSVNLTFGSFFLLFFSGPENLPFVGVGCFFLFGSSFFFWVVFWEIFFWWHRCFRNWYQIKDA